MRPTLINDEEWHIYTYTGIVKNTYLTGQWGNIGFELAHNKPSTTYLDIAWAKLEFGSVATTFVPPDPATELVKCQRYFRLIHFSNLVRPTRIASDKTTLSFSINIKDYHMTKIPKVSSTHTPATSNNPTAYSCVIVPDNNTGIGWTNLSFVESINVSLEDTILYFTVNPVVVPSEWRNWVILLGSKGYVILDAVT